ncbi:DNA polymerase/3'-5' exonuclease PolX [Pelotomaculum terephthalicicum JT]|uniref:DNA polymerase/3'-5' exonuclease PolX n=1 Tax=Pelotomaculum terephthalicicum TaxID=206393 RepID=UPI001F0340D5|nr:DNA polymerase/3'-5' exonuclease PolX [Pelotomaculum terephthalicicum]MCG9968148.1 DNA polymerase/3'-5' exonuclease PolX [Pelotomaculum terephthalicicum JT]
MRNAEIARIFYELAELHEFKGDDFFKIRAYRNAAKVLAGLSEPVEKIKKNRGLQKIPGIGKNIAKKIEEILLTGRLQKHEELLREVPPGVMEIMSLPGIGPKRAYLLQERLNITSPEELAEAARAKRVRGLPGMGVKLEMDIIRNVEMIKRRSGKVLLATARELAAELTEYLKIIPGVIKVEVGGSIRRWRETVGDIDLVVAAEEANEVFEAMASHPRIKEVSEKAANRAGFYSWWGIYVELEVVPEEMFFPALHKSTGSKAHLSRLQEKFGVKGVDFTRLVMERTGIMHGEEDIYAALGMPYIPPEIREDRGEIECALKDSLPQLVKQGDIVGDLHIHTSWSDGVASIEQVVQRAKEKGYKYLAITDHSQSLKIAKGLSLEKLKEQHREIALLNEKFDENNEEFRILTGIEADILPGGELDCPDEILEKTDLVVASVHRAFKQDREKMTGRIISAIKNKNVDIIGHATGRLLGRRDGYALDMERVLDAAAACGTILEINSSPDRLDLNDVNARSAKAKGIKIAVNTDAHDLKRMDEMPYGIAVARRAWLGAGDIVNTMPLDKLLAYLDKKN